MKKSIILKVTILLTSIILMSFNHYKQKSAETKFGGSASARGKYTYMISDWQKLQGIHVGDETTINATVDCLYYDKPGAKGGLKSEIDSQALTKAISITSDIEYSINACE